MPISKQRRLKKEAKQQAILKRQFDAMMNTEGASPTVRMIEDEKDDISAEWLREDPNSPYFQAIAEGVREDSVEGCLLCVCATLEAEADRQMKLRRRYGTSWDGRLHFRFLQQHRLGGRRDAQGRKVTWAFIRWMEGKGLVKEKNGKMVWVHFYPPK